MDPTIERAEKRLEWLSSDEETLRLYEAREEALIERNSLQADWEARGRAEGRKEGREEGREEGRKAGREEGRAEGEARARVENARNMLRKGLDHQLIAEVTGLSRKEVARLAEKNNE